MSDASAELASLRAALERLTEAAERLRAYGTQANRAALLAEARRAREVLGGDGQAALEEAERRNTEYERYAYGTGIRL